MQDISCRQEPCDDAVSRQGALDALYDYWHDIYQVDCTGYDVFEDSKEVIDALPPVNPQEQEQKIGRWIEEDINEWSHKIYCSECGCPPPFEYVSNGDVYSASGYGVTNKTKHCPGCGARMIKSEENK